MKILPKRISDKINQLPSGCWEWTAALDRAGYGRVGWERATQPAHRVVYMILVGPIPDGLPLDHTCHDPATCAPPCQHRRCVNPAHLEPVTVAENLRRSGARRAVSDKYAEPRACPQGHPLSGDNLYVTKTKAGHTNRKCRTCNRENVARWKARHAAD